jgi:hypothetical protein
VTSSGFNAGRGRALVRDHQDVKLTLRGLRFHRFYFAFAGLRDNLDSVKSKAKILLLGVDEVDPDSSNAGRSRSRPCAGIGPDLGFADFA